MRERSSVGNGNEVRENEVRQGMGTKLSRYAPSMITAIVAAGVAVAIFVLTEQPPDVTSSESDFLNDLLAGLFGGIPGLYDPQTKLWLGLGIRQWAHAAEFWLLGILVAMSAYFALNPQLVEAGGLARADGLAKPQLAKADVLAKPQMAKPDEPTPAGGLAPAGGLVKAGVLALAICAACSLFDQCHKLFVPGRHFDGFDLVMDAVGYGIAVLTVLLIAMVASKRR